MDKIQEFMRLAEEKIGIILAKWLFRSFTALV
jgi:hypothetical protein